MTTKAGANNAGKKDHTAERLLMAAVLDGMTREKDLDNLTVIDICKAANISRTSFYRLFEDKYDAANWYMFQVLDVGNALTGRNYTWYEGNVVTFSGCLLLKNLMASAWKSQGYHAMKEVGIRKKYSDLTSTITDHLHLELTDELDFQCRTFAYLESYIVRTWIAKDEPEPVETMAAYIDHVVPPQLHELLNHPADPRPAERLTWGTLAQSIS
jgi:AcrR family transcriptional regulator